MKPHLLFLLGVLCSALSYSQTPQYRYVANTAGLQKMIDSVGDRAEPGFSLLVLHNDSVIFKSYRGLANIEAKKKIDETTQFYIASISKTFTAAAIMNLRKEKKLQLEDRISKYIPGLPNVMKDVRIYNLLNHTSGITDFYDVLGENLKNFHNKNVLEFTQRQDSLLFEPGVNFSYSNTAYILLSFIIEKVSGLSYAEYLKQSFFIPLQMNNTTVIDKPGISISNKVTGYKVDSSAITKNDYEDIYTTGAGGIYSTVTDLSKWLIALKNGKIISKRSFDIMTEFPTTMNGARSYFGMGWTNETYGPKTPDLYNLKVFGSIGTLKGFNSIIKYFPDQDVAFIVLSNSNYFRSDLYSKIERLIFKRIELK